MAYPVQGRSHSLCRPSQTHPAPTRPNTETRTQAGARGHKHAADEGRGRDVHGEDVDHEHALQREEERGERRESEERGEKRGSEERGEERGSEE
jgi:hypothetical protein